MAAIVSDDIFNRIFLNKNDKIPIQIPLKYVPSSPIDNKQALVQVMASRRSRGKPLSEPMMVRLLTHICVTRPRWVNINPNVIELIFSRDIQAVIRNNLFLNLSYVSNVLSMYDYW